ncbi:phospholipase D-like domain-containing protein [Rhizobium sp. VS19-DR104.2]|uniref:restriction endonuclease PLD domain-containing protein n=1 Tax=unclassified Rhizobium TaxID=2613769 RepID=UPI001CC61411|nr:MULTISPECIES: restriction endonuclease PLD domain-containing protein [unclassified Rhizobium]MBZ5763055.1 phospholipase D-like domain-containing protein [Rhizobium sp. VS19-DR96]MBZ5768833.1 phospholipase D-like domain-containing protein [Rhizobium sp. VS19-DR129.2]MBZ5776363.1 phospholipase D-like domain-containing protein [Rhizobium sp. VS19-DRK62.2]MBZ5787570.1 phospholipase D-like domain-containing protein [Rhizobium sp. VS19-DR121]MBZ5804925.1 phospholipase D-like domain-containing pro
MLIVQNAVEPAAIRNAIADLIAPAPISMQIAAAYVTRSGSEILLTAVKNASGAGFVPMPKVLITSFDFGITEPEALRRWQALPNTEVRVSGARPLLKGVLSPGQAFHPKIFAFGTDADRFNALVGSANLTSRGFSVNTEAAWSQRGIPRTQIEKAFAIASHDTVLLTDALLTAYEDLRERLPRPREIQQEAEPVEPAVPPAAEAIPLFRTVIENGEVNAGAFGAMWLEGGDFQGGSHNQIELPRGAHRFFGYDFNDYNVPQNRGIGTPILRCGARVWEDRLLAWHGNSRMERLNLPTLIQGGFNYAGTAVMFRRLQDGSFELIITEWDSDLARSWRNASMQRNTLFRLGSIATNRLVGLI